MGTSGAFGGSKTLSWKDVADHLADPGGESTSDDADSAGDGASDPDDQPEDGRHPEDETSPAAKLADLVAKALQDDDPSLKPKSAPASRHGDSGLSYGKLVGSSRRTGTTRAAPGGGRRHISASVGRAGRAVGAGYALATGSATDLASYGLHLPAIEGMAKIDQIFAIMEAVEVGNSGPDDVALRGALYDVLDRILSDDQETSPVETLREFVGEYAIQLFAIELDALIQDGKLDLEQRSETLKELREVIRFDASRLDLEGAVLATPEQFAHAAQQLMRATLAIVREGDLK